MVYRRLLSKVSVLASTRTVPSRAALVFTVATAMLFAVGNGVANGVGAQHDHDHSGSANAPTAEQQAAADELGGATQAVATRFADSAAAEAAGYRVVTPFAFYGARAAHFHNDAYAADDRLLDPERPEQLVYLKRDDGRLILLGVMYIAPVGTGPAIGGPLTNWHTHDDLCANAAGPIPSLATGECPAGTRPLGFEMLHVWLVDHPDGPFADWPPPSAVEGPAVLAQGGSALAVGASLVDTAALFAAVGETLGLQPAEIGVRYAAGDSLAEMAEAQGVPRQAVVDVIVRRLTLDYDRAVAAGDMTPEHRDLLVSTLPMMVERMVDLHAGEPWLLTPTEHAH